MARTPTPVVECEITILMDENGCWHVGKADDVDAIMDNLSFDFGKQCRRLNLVVRMTPPEAQLLAIDVSTSAPAATVNIGA